MESLDKVFFYGFMEKALGRNVDLILSDESKELIKKLEDLTSRDNAKQLHRQVFIYNRIKADNDAIYTNVDAMSEEEQFALLATDGMIVKRPLLVGEDFVFTGFKEAEWEEKLLK